MAEMSLDALVGLELVQLEKWRSQPAAEAVSVPVNLLHMVDWLVLSFKGHLERDCRASGLSGQALPAYQRLQQLATEMSRSIDDLLPRGNRGGAGNLNTAISGTLCEINPG